jgi:hypothetical protein
MANNSDTVLGGAARGRARLGARHDKKVAAGF